jgi:hypothetical protein
LTSASAAIWKAAETNLLPFSLYSPEDADLIVLYVSDSAKVDQSAILIKPAVEFPYSVKKHKFVVIGGRDECITG